MKRLLKRLLVLVLLVAVGTAAYQVWAFMSFYNLVRETTERHLERYREIGREEFAPSLARALEKIGLSIEPQLIAVQEDKATRSVRVEFRYTRPLTILVFSYDKEMLVWRTLRDVDFG